MRALLLDETPRLVDDYPSPEPPRGEALVRVRVASVCNTDLELIAGYRPSKSRSGVVPGRKLVGIVEGAPGAGDWEGKQELDAAPGAAEANHE
jgi:NADPH:quinone reductase-like Zn-dependent oxidoreductase